MAGSSFANALEGSKGQSFQSQEDSVKRLGHGHFVGNHYSAYHSPPSEPQTFLSILYAKYIHPAQPSPKSQLITVAIRNEYSGQAGNEADTIWM